MKRPYRPRSTAREEARYLAKIWTELEKNLIREAKRVLPGLVAAFELRDQERADASEDDRDDLLSSLTPPAVAGLGATIQEQADRLLELSARDLARLVESQTELSALEFRARAQAMAVNPLANRPRLRRLVREWAQENVRLITSIPERYLDDLRAEVLRAFESGERAESLARRIQAKFLTGTGETSTDRLAVARRRAELIAQDQVAKLKARLDQERVSSLGSKRYRWVTSRDERVRQEHQRRQGRIFEWSSPPSDGHPGEPIRCRCVAEPLLPDDLMEQFPELAQEQAAPGLRSRRPARPRRRLRQGRQSRQTRGARQGR